MDMSFIYIGIIVIIFIICITLLIFAPKSINYYDLDTYPILKYITENNKDVINNSYANIETDDGWVNWPDSSNVKGLCSIFPLFMFSTLSKNRKQKCQDLFKLMKNIPDVKSCAFIRIDKKSKIIKHTEWKDLSNNTLRCIFIIKSIASAPMDLCGIWVNGETKKLISGKCIIFDGSKEHSIYNETDYPVCALLLDIKRPYKIPNGISIREYSDDINDFVCKLNSE
jgi:aspartyl/asparaginyl beta-hydroxylase (cupin superfamily)